MSNKRRIKKPKKKGSKMSDQNVSLTNEQLQALLAAKNQQQTITIDQLLGGVTGGAMQISKMLIQMQEHAQYMHSAFNNLNTAHANLTAEHEALKNEICNAREAQKQPVVEEKPKNVVEMPVNENGIYEESGMKYEDEKDN